MGRAVKRLCRGQYVQVDEADEADQDNSGDEEFEAEEDDD